MQNEPQSWYNQEISPEQLGRLNHILNPDGVHVAELLANKTMVMGTEVGRTTEELRAFIRSVDIGKVIMVDNRPAVVIGGCIHKDESPAPDNLAVRYADGTIDRFAVTASQLALAA